MTRRTRFSLLGMMLVLLQTLAPFLHAHAHAHSGAGAEAGLAGLHVHVHAGVGADAHQVHADSHDQVALGVPPAHRVDDAPPTPHAVPDLLATRDAPLMFDAVRGHAPPRAPPDAPLAFPDHFLPAPLAPPALLS
jgi:hypothetical protein